MESIEKEFRYRGVSVTRRDYEALPMPMFASGADDLTMRRVAKGTYERLCAAGWSDAQIGGLLRKRAERPFDTRGDAERIRQCFWDAMEKAALDEGIQYYGGD